MEIMKSIINKICIIFVILSLASCDDFLDINRDPSFPQSADGFSVLPPLFSQMARGEAFDSRYAGQYIQNIAWITANNAFDQHGYSPGTDAAGEKWRQHYWAIGKNIDLIVNESTATEKWDYVGAALAIRAWSWQSSTDVYGEMILKQAWEPNRYIFDFDSQDLIYQEVVRLCEESLEYLNRTDGKTNEASLGRGDLVYKGNRQKWIKFVYSILARNAHHISNKANYDPNKVIEYVDKSFASNADNFDVPHAGTSSADGNFYGAIRGNFTNFRQSSYIVKLLNGSILGGGADPRLPKMLTASPDGVFRGVEPTKGDTTNVANKPTRIPLLFGVAPGTAAASTPGKYIFKNNAVHPIVTYYELQFMKAEAALKKGDNATAFDAFKKGITAHMQFADVSAGDIATYLASEAVPQDAASLTLSDVMLQKYIALWMHGALESWVDMRRHNYSPSVYTGFTLPEKLYLDNGSKTVQRMRPRFNSEYVWNAESLISIGADQADYHTKPVWFVTQ